jgi:hypothetical protein
MPARKGLRAVSPNEKAPRKPAKPKNVAAAAKSGSQRDLLVAMRDRIATAVTNPDCPPRDLASLSRRLQDIAKEIESIDAREKEEREADEARKNIVSDGDDVFDAEAL